MRVGRQGEWCVVKGKGKKGRSRKGGRNGSNVGSRRKADGGGECV